MSYKIADALQDAYKRQWTMVNTFTVQIHLTPFLIDAVGSITEDINLNIISMTTPDFTNDPIEIFEANHWTIQNGRDNLYRFTITFRDHDQFSLYRKFFRIYHLTKENYFDDVSLMIIINKDPDHANESERLFMMYSGALVESVSNVAFSNDTANQIAEFTVGFKCTKPFIV